MNQKSQTSFDTSPRKTDKVYIYGLYAASDKGKRIMYVGQSIDPSVRAYLHLCAKKFEGEAKMRWVASLRENGDSIGIRILEICSKQNANRVEDFWIAHYKKINPELKNNFRPKQSVIRVRNRFGKITHKSINLYET